MASRCNCSRERDGRYARDQCGTRAELGDDAARVEVSSAGIGASPGQPASEGSRRVAAADGVDLSAHRSRTVTAGMARAADFVFVMTAEHRAAVVALGVPAEQVHVLSEWPEPGEPELEPTPDAGLPDFTPERGSQPQPGLDDETEAAA